MKQRLSKPQIIDYIPHRFENLVIDECERMSDEECNYSLTLKPNDIIGRDIFLINNHVIPVPLLTEITALACIVCSGKLAPGQFAYFAAITSLQTNGKPFLSKHCVRGMAKKTKSKKEFYKYSFSITCGDAEISGDLMAYFSTSESPEESPLPIELPQHVASAMGNPSTQIPSLKLKRPLMTFLNNQTTLNPTNEWLFDYQYPLNHPLIKGHFPGNPVMMGINQWAMIEDAMSHLFQTNQLPSDVIHCNATIFNKHHHPVCELKSMTLTPSIISDTPMAVTTSIKKILFKSSVRPGDTLFAYIQKI